MVGERGAGMGGAFTALADEATGAFYNPAGIVVDQSALIQASMSAYKLRYKRATVLDVCGKQLEEDDSGFFGFPATFGFVKLFGSRVRHAVGLTLAVPQAERSSQGTVVEGAVVVDGAVVRDAVSDVHAAMTRTATQNRISLTFMSVCFDNAGRLCFGVGLTGDAAALGLVDPC